MIDLNNLVVNISSSIKLNYVLDEFISIYVVFVKIMSIFT